jgi:hypothetical protein
MIVKQSKVGLPEHRKSPLVTANQLQTKEEEKRIRVMQCGVRLLAMTGKEKWLVQWTTRFRQRSA